MSDTKDQAKKQTAADMDDELRRIQLEAARLELEERKANLQDVKERLEERQLKRESLKERSRTNALTLQQNAERERQSQSRCTHRKGGNGMADYVGGRGQEPQFAVLKHIMFNGDTWVRCMRCGKTWKPPLEKTHTFNGVFDREKFEAAVRDYHEAVNFQTKNSTSSSAMFRYSDGGKYSREVLEYTTLR